MKKAIHFKWYFSFLFLMIGSSANAAEMCRHIFHTPEVMIRDVDFGLNRTSRVKSLRVPEELSNYSTIKSELWKAMDTLPAKRRAEVDHLLLSVEFFDYTHTAREIVPAFLEGKKTSFNFTRLYDVQGEKTAAPYNGFISARNYLIQKQPPVTAELLFQLHSRIMEGGVEGVGRGDLGAIRHQHWMGNVAGEFRITPREKAVIEENPYLSFQHLKTSQSHLKESTWNKITIWGEKRGMRLENQDPTLIEGRIHYPFVLTPKLETIRLIEKSHPELFKEIMAYREKNKPDINGAGPEALERKFTKALVEERFDRFLKEKSKLGEIRIGKNEHRYIDLVADFQRDIVAIHPLLNGNGRTTRLLMNYLLTSEGLPPVRLVDPFLDVQVSKEQWREYVHKGVINNAQLKADILHRIENNLTIEHSPELIYPGLPETIQIALKRQSSNKVVENHAITKVESEQFNAFIKTMFEMHPELKTELKNDQLRTMSRLADLFVEYHRTKTLRFMHEKDGEREIRLRLVETDFVETFGVNTSKDVTRWNEKIDRWYERDMLAWRGLSNSHREPTMTELLDYFRKPTSHLVSNRVLGKLNRKPLLDAIKEDFADFNRDMITGDMVEIAVDHHRSGPKYGISYGYSTSKREVVGKAFAMGAMVVGEYGKHMDPAAQAKLKSRINVASFRALKDVDLGRLKAFDGEFSYIYGRQAEVMGIGGTDPDAVMLLQRLDAQGQVMQTLLRNVNNPNEIFVIQGRYVPGEGPLPTNRIIETHLLAK